MNKLTKIAYLSLIALSVAGFAAADTSVSVLPTAATKNLGQTFNATVELSVQGNNVCVVSGDIAFSNLSCQSITALSGIMAQTSPSCQSPHFVVGIPQCTLSAKTLFNVSVAANNPGNAAITLSNVQTINQGGQVASTSQNGSYSIVGVLSSSTGSTGQNSTTFASSAANTAASTQNTTDDQNSASQTGSVEGNQTTNPLENTAAGVSASANGNGFLASVKDAVFNKETAWILLIIALLIAAYFIVKSFYKKTPPTPPKQ